MFFELINIPVGFSPQEIKTILLLLW
jgi:hypothetical protein